MAMPVTDTRQETSAPIFVLCAARSGSTLLRYLLDAHPAIAAPPETNLSVAAESMAFTTFALAESVDDARREATARCREFVTSALDRYMRDRGKVRWCDKSLPSILHTKLLEELFPDAQYIALHRDCRDFIISAVEANPWGFNGYGFDPYMRGSADNFVRGLAIYWIDRTEAALRFEEQNPTRVFRMRYEDLTRTPVLTLAKLAKFLDVDPQPFGDANVAFQLQHTDGAGDHKIRHTREVSSRSIGRGWRVPVELFPPPVLDQVNALSKELDYDYVDGSSPVTVPSLAEPRRGGVAAIGELVAVVSSAMRSAGVESHLGEGCAAVSLTVVGEQCGPLSIRWCGDPEHCGRAVDVVLYVWCDAESVGGLLAGANVATLIRAGQLHAAGSDRLQIGDFLEAFSRALS